MKVYRHPYSRALRPDPLTRPPLPTWLQKALQEHVKLGKSWRSYSYWKRMYWATPPWLSDEQVARMKRMKETCPDGYHLDHEVPLSNPLVCGLNVPWNLVAIPDKENIRKSNNHWPGMAMQPQDLFDPHSYEAFALNHPG